MKRMPPAVALAGGVCSGIAYEFRFPTWLIRALVLIFSFSVPAIPVIYLLLWFCMLEHDEVPKDYPELCE